MSTLATKLSDTRRRTQVALSETATADPLGAQHVSFHLTEASYSLFSRTSASPPLLAPQQVTGVWGDSSYWKQRFSSSDRRFDPYESAWKAPSFQDPSLRLRQGFDAAPGGPTHGPHATSIYDSMPGIPPSVPRTPLNRNEVDSWIDDLDERRSNLPSAGNGDLTDNIAMAWFVQQTLPRAKIPTFDGAPSGWLPFITKFFTLVHKQVFLTDAQRHMYLLDHLTGEPKTAVKCFSDN